MANNSNKAKATAAAALLKYGVRYGPLVANVIKSQREPAKEMANKQFARANHRRHALEHAHHLIDGSVMTVFDGDQRLYVVFNGDTPIASHPASRKPLAQLVQGYDLAKRIRADDAAAARTGVTIRLPRPIRPANPMARRRRPKAIEGQLVNPPPGSTPGGSSAPASPEPSAGGAPGTSDSGTGS